MVSIWDFDSQSGGSSPPASAIMESYTVDSSGAGYKLTAFGLGWFQSRPGPPSNICVCGETGKRVALRALWWQHFIGSSPITRTKMSLWRNRQTRTAQTRFVMGSTPIRLTI